MPDRMTDHIPKGAIDVFQNHLGRVVQGLDNNSIPTLCNGTVNRFTPCTIEATAGIPSAITAHPGHSSSSRVSLADKSLVTLESCMS